MYYFFVDEAYSRTGTHTNIALASWAVEQIGWSRQAERLDELHRSPILHSISAMLDRLDARANISIARLENTVFRGGETDGTDDIPRMSRTDNIWSQCVIFGVGSLMKDLVEAGQEVGTVDIYFDPKSLKVEHFEAIEGTLRNLMAKAAKDYAIARNSKLLKKFSIRRIQPVKKPEAGQAPDKFQAGTEVADKLCTNSEKVVQLNPKRITRYEISDVVRRTAQQFDGIPFK